MLFYCPNCQKEYEVEPKETITTLQKRVAYKAECPVCHQDMAEFLPPQPASPKQPDSPLTVNESQPAASLPEQPQPTADLPEPTPTPVQDTVEDVEAQKALNMAAQTLAKNPVAVETTPLATEDLAEV